MLIACIKRCLVICFFFKCLLVNGSYAEQIDNLATDDFQALLDALQKERRDMMHGDDNVLLASEPPDTSNIFAAELQAGQQSDEVFQDNQDDKLVVDCSLPVDEAMMRLAALELNNAIAYSNVYGVSHLRKDDETIVSTFNPEHYEKVCEDFSSALSILQAEPLLDDVDRHRLDMLMTLVRVERKLRREGRFLGELPIIEILFSYLKRVQFNLFFLQINDWSAIGFCNHDVLKKKEATQACVNVLDNLQVFLLDSRVPINCKISLLAQPSYFASIVWRSLPARFKGSWLRRWFLRSSFEYQLEALLSSDFYEQHPDLAQRFQQFIEGFSSLPVNMVSDDCRCALLTTIEQLEDELGLLGMMQPCYKIGCVLLACLLSDARCLLKKNYKFSFNSSQGVVFVKHIKGIIANTEYQKIIRGDAALSDLFDRYKVIVDSYLSNTIEPMNGLCEIHSLLTSLRLSQYRSIRLCMLAKIKFLDSFVATRSIKQLLISDMIHILECISKLLMQCVGDTEQQFINQVFTAAPLSLTTAKKEEMSNTVSKKMQEFFMQLTRASVGSVSSKMHSIFSLFGI